MARHMRKALALLAVFAVAPASAGHPYPTAAVRHHDSNCPYGRARIAAAKAVAVNAGTKGNGEATVSAGESAPAEGSLFDLGRRLALMP